MCRLAEILEQLREHAVDVRDKRMMRVREFWRNGEKFCNVDKKRLLLAMIVDYVNVMCVHSTIPKKTTEKFECNSIKASITLSPNAFIKISWEKWRVFSGMNMFMRERYKKINIII